MKKTKHETDTSKLLLGKTIYKADITGSGVKLILSDGTVLDYDSFDGGGSAWCVYKIELVEIDHAKKMTEAKGE